MVNPTGYTALDLIGYTDKGDYSSSATYVRNDLVHYNSSIWRCLVDDTTHVTPVEGAAWTLFIQQPGVMTGATSSANGKAGLVPAPAKANRTQFLKGNGTWATPDLPADMTGATSSAAGAHGLVPAPIAGDDKKALFGDGNFKLPMSTWSGSCATAADQRIKEVTTGSDFVLQAGAVIVVRFTNTNTFSSTTDSPVQLNVNGTGNVNIWYNTAHSGNGNTGTGSKYYGDSSRPIIYIYDGTYWVWVSQSRDTDTTYTPQGLGFGYGTCSTAAATAAKTATLSGYALTKNGIVCIRFTNSVPANATLNVNSKGAKAIMYKGVAIVAGIIKAGDMASFVYTGSYYVLIAIAERGEPFTGATSSTDGTAGQVPAPSSGDSDRFLKGDGTWSNPTASTMTGATASTGGTGGSVPAPSAGDQNKAFTGGGTYVDSLVKDRVLEVTLSSVSSLPQTISNASVESDMVVVNSTLSNPAAQTGDWTVTTSSGSLTLSGNISGTTNITLYLMKSR